MKCFAENWYLIILKRVKQFYKIVIKIYEFTFRNPCNALKCKSTKSTTACLSGLFVSNLPFELISSTTKTEISLDSTTVFPLKNNIKNIPYLIILLINLDRYL